MTWKNGFEKNQVSFFHFVLSVVFVAGVHDSYWTHAGDVEQMNVMLRENFVELYEQPILENVSVWILSGLLQIHLISQQKVYIYTHQRRASINQEEFCGNCWSGSWVCCGYYFAAVKGVSRAVPGSCIPRHPEARWFWFEGSAQSPLLLQLDELSAPGKNKLSIFLHGAFRKQCSESIFCFSFSFWHNVWFPGTFCTNVSNGMCRKTPNDVSASLLSICWLYSQVILRVTIRCINICLSSVWWHFFYLVLWHHPTCTIVLDHRNPIK